MSDFHKNKLYRVKEIVDREGRTCYKVEAAKSKWFAFLGEWIGYDKDNSTLDEAIKQIEIIDEYKVKKEKVVHTEIRD